MTGVLPREGTTLRKALNMLAALPPGVDATTREVADATGLNVRSIGGQLFYLIGRGLVVQGIRGGSGRITWRASTEEERSTFVVHNRRDEDISAEMLTRYYPPTTLVGQLRDAMALGSSKSGNPTQALGDVISLAMSVLERSRERPQFADGAVAVAVAHEVASIARACETAATNLRELLNGLYT